MKKFYMWLAIVILAVAGLAYFVWNYLLPFFIYLGFGRWFSG